MTIDPATPTTLYAGTWWRRVQEHERRREWGTVNTGLTNTDVLALAIDPATPATLYAGTRGGGVFKSTNGGGEWSAFNTGLTAMYVGALAISRRCQPPSMQGRRAAAFAIQEVELGHRTYLPLILRGQ